MALAEDGHGGRSSSKGEVQGEEANSKAVVAAKTGNLAVSVLCDDVLALAHFPGCDQFYDF